MRIIYEITTNFGLEGSSKLGLNPWCDNLRRKKGTKYPCVPQKHGSRADVVFSGISVLTEVTTVTKHCNLEKLQNNFSNFETPSLAVLNLRNA